MSEGALRAEPRPAGLPVLERLAGAILERALAHIEGGSLEVQMPGGASRRFGTGAPVAVTINDTHLFRRLASRGAMGLGESYMAGEWDARDLVGLFELLLRNGEAAARRHPTLRRVLDAPPRPNRRNGLFRARRNIAYHYDLGNDLFELMLDPGMTYSCAVFESDEDTLEEAQHRKYAKICEKLEVGPADRVLEIGCGWGGFALHAATERGCRVTGLTISRAQASYARNRISSAGLGDAVEIVEQDYRLHRGSYTKVVSIEMLEAIGEKQFGTYFATIDRMLEPGGRACVQTILVPDDRYDRYRKSPDWIERYIFPGCLIPSLNALAAASARSSHLMIHEVEEIGPHYAETLRHWRESFLRRIDEVRALGYDERFERTWVFYLAFCEAAFRTRWIRDVQLTLVRALGA